MVQLALLSTYIWDQSYFVVQQMWNLMTRKLAIPWKTEGLVVSWRNVYHCCQTKRFPFKKGKSTIIAEKKQFLLILGHAITVHKSQGSTLDYMQGDLYWSTCKNTAIGKEYQQSIS